MLYTIGEFSQMVRVPIKTLRYYDSVSLFSPNEVDPSTNYRKYSDSQIPDILLIAELRRYGLSINRVKKLMKDPQSLELVDLIDERLLSINNEISKLEDLKYEMLHKKELLNSDELFWKDYGYHDFTIKNVRDKVVYYEQHRISNIDMKISLDEIIRHIINKIDDTKLKKNATPMIIYYFDEDDTDTVMVDICIEVNKQKYLAPNKYKTIKGGAYASVIHIGYVTDKDYVDALNNVDSIFYEELKKRKLTMSGPPIELVRKMPKKGHEDKEERVLEYLVPLMDKPINSSAP